MEKPANSSVPLHDLIQRRWSPVHLSSRPIPHDELAGLFEAARWAPSSYNEQPWSFLLATLDQEDEFSRMLGCLMEANQAWAKHAGALAISVANGRYARSNKPNQHAWHDVGLATANLILQAMSQGLYCHVMGGFNSAQARSLYKIPEYCEPVAAIAIGYPGEGTPADAAIADRDRGPRTRKPLAEVVYQGTWGQPGLAVK